MDFVNGSWVESTITTNLSPALGNTIVPNVPITSAEKNQYILIDITSALQAWLSGSQANDGIALVANSSFNASFDSKENTTTSHPAELDVVFAGGNGTYHRSAHQFGFRSGLTGGGTSGTLNLSLTNTCATNQVLAVERNSMGVRHPQGHRHHHRRDGGHRPDRWRHQWNGHLESGYHQGSPVGRRQYLHNQSGHCGFYDLCIRIDRLRAQLSGHSCPGAGSDYRRTALELQPAGTGEI